MKAYSNMPMDEFIFQLRQAAIRGNAGPLIVDKIDQLRGSDDDEAERISELESEIEELEARIESLKEQLHVEPV